MDPNGLMQLLQMLHAGGFGSKTPQGQLPTPGGAPPNIMGAPPAPAPQQGAGMNPMALGGLLPMLMGGGMGGGGNGAPLAGAGLGGLAGMLMGGR